MSEAYGVEEFLTHLEKERDVSPNTLIAYKRDLEELCRQVRLAMGSGDRKKMEDATAALNDRLLNFAYLL